MLPIKKRPRPEVPFERQNQNVLMAVQSPSKKIKIDKVYTLPTVVISNHSKYFERMFSGQFKESKSDRPIDLSAEIPKEAKDVVISYLLTGQVNTNAINSENVFSVLNCSQFLLLPDVEEYIFGCLEDTCDWVSGTDNISNFPNFWKMSEASFHRILKFAKGDLQRLKLIKSWSENCKSPSIWESAPVFVTFAKVTHIKAIRLMIIFMKKNVEFIPKILFKKLWRKNSTPFPKKMELLNIYLSSSKTKGKDTPAVAESAKSTDSKVEPAEEKNPADKSPADKSPADKSPADKSPADKSPADKSPADKSEVVEEVTKLMGEGAVSSKMLFQLLAVNEGLRTQFIDSWIASGQTKYIKFLIKGGVVLKQAVQIEKDTVCASWRGLQVSVKLLINQTNRGVGSHALRRGIRELEPLV